MTRGRRLLVAWALFAQSVLIILAGLVLSRIDGSIGQHSKELVQIEKNTKATQGLTTTIENALTASEHSNAGTIYIEFLTNICKATPGCHLPPARH
jgi:hypothetical protein